MARPTSHPIKKVLGLSAELAEAISEYRHRERIASENEAIRRLIEAGLKAGDKISIRGSKPEPSGGSESGTGGTGKHARTRKAPERKAAPVSKEAHLRALREQGAR